MDAGGSLQQGENPGREIDAKSIQDTVDFKNEWSHTSTPPYFIMVCTGQFYCYLGLSFISVIIYKIPIRNAEIL